MTETHESQLHVSLLTVMTPVTGKVLISIHVGLTVGNNLSVSLGFCGSTTMDLEFIFVSDITCACPGRQYLIRERLLVEEIRDHN